MPENVQPEVLVEEFTQFFINKIAQIRASLDKHEIQLDETTFKGDEMASFREVTNDEIKSIIMSSNSKSCELDAIPTHLLKATIEMTCPFITTIINNSLKSGIFPDAYKKALVRPLIKKPGLDPNDLKNYRPVSNLQFLSKVMEKVVLKQLNEHLVRNELKEPFQSAYRQNHSTETALLRVLNDLNEVVDNGETTLLCLLDLSAAFDTIDHKILIRRLESTFGIRGSALKWFESYLSNRIQSVIIGDATSVERTLPFGVPQGSVLGPELFVLYTKSVGNIIKSHDLDYQLYADDSQMYDTTQNITMKEKVDKYERCVTDLKEWMSQNRLKLNAEKTEAVLIGSKKQRMKIDQKHIEIEGSNIDFKENARNLGVIIDSGLNMTDHVKNLKRSILFELKKISSIRDVLTNDACKKLVVSLLFSKLDYCNSLLSNTAAENISRLQSIQNNAARLVMKKNRRDDAALLLYQLHWLPVCQRIRYKAASIVYKCVEESAPSYLQDLLSLQQHKRTLRSSSDPLLLKIPRTRLKAGEKSFSFFGPSTWNSLPYEIRNSPSLDTFKKQLKTFLFRDYFV